VSAAYVRFSALFSLTVAYLLYDIHGKIRTVCACKMQSLMNLLLMLNDLKTKYVDAVKTVKFLVVIKLLLNVQQRCVVLCKSCR
jgi:hypothetical protein